MSKKPFLRYFLDHEGRWRKERVDDPTQPPKGFTISAEEQKDEIDLLRKTYEIANREQQDLIRLFARLSLENPSDVPRSQFSP
jgi:hypothetical protein